MKITRAAAVPLAVHDPFFSVWCGGDELNAEDPRHWSGIRQQMRGYVIIDDASYCFLGNPEFHPTISQKSIDVTATATTYVFENDKIILTVRFTSPLLLDDMLLVSRPCTYIDYHVSRKQPCQVRVELLISEELVTSKKDRLVGCSFERGETEGCPAYCYASMGRAKQEPLSESGDNVTMNWGYVYLAALQGRARVAYDGENRRIFGSMELPEADPEQTMILAYDDLLSINYMGQWRRAYWTGFYPNILEAIGAAFADREEVLSRAEKLDQKLEDLALRVGGEAYAFLCSLSYRQAVAAHKLITDEAGNILFLSKENDSNGCIGTVDVSYPSIPLFLLFNTEYVKGMMRPIFDFAGRDVWEYDFAPHDVGRYPYAWGQVYGLMGKEAGQEYSLPDPNVMPPFYQYPAGSQIYDLRFQMPVEECGDMLLMAAAVCLKDGNADFVKPYWEQLQKWVGYLLQYGTDPGEQLCTDDFAGHLAHNVNLSAKAILGIEAYAQLAALGGDSETAAEYHQKAKDMAEDWEKRAKAGDHYVLSFGKEESWSLKYNLIWDKLFDSGLFSEEVFEKECRYYVERIHRYGTPLDSRREYTKSDWILWCAAMAADPEDAKKLIAPVARYLEETKSRYPFGDWYETDTGEICAFKGRSVQGGIFMPILKALWN